MPTSTRARPQPLEQLAKLGTPFKTNGTVTAGNASGVNDGAAGLLIASGEAVQQYGLMPDCPGIGGSVGRVFRPA